MNNPCEQCKKRLGLPKIKVISNGFPLLCKGCKDMVLVHYRKQSKKLDIRMIDYLIESPLLYSSTLGLI